jgi:hypothetical protein
MTQLYTPDDWELDRYEDLESEIHQLLPVPVRIFSAQLPREAVKITARPTPRRWLAW